MKWSNLDNGLPMHTMKVVLDESIRIRILNSSIFMFKMKRYLNNGIASGHVGGTQMEIPFISYLAMHRYLPDWMMIFDSLID